MKTALIFGANGYIGRHLIHYLRQHEFNCCASGNKPISIDGLSNYIPVDITHKSQLNKLDFHVDYIFLFAGITGTLNGFENPEKFIDVNEKGLLNILNHCVSTKSKARLIFPSTRLVYKGKKDTALEESSPKEAKTIYAQNKISGESYLEMYFRHYNIRYTIFRICVPYGSLFDGQSSYGTLDFFLNQATKGKNITLYGDGDLKRTFTHIQDVCQIIIQTLGNGISVNETYNIGSNDNMSLYDVANMIAKKFHVSVEFIEWDTNNLKIESGDTIFDDTKLMTETNYEYQKSFQDWIKDLS